MERQAEARFIFPVQCVLGTDLTISILEIITTKYLQEIIIEW